MIKNKNQFKNALKNGTIKGIKRKYNFDSYNKIPVGTCGIIETIQTNAFTIKYNMNIPSCWVYYDNIDIIDNEIIYYNYIPERRLQEAQETIKNKGLDVELIPLEEKEKEKVNKGSNQNYTHKYIIIKNEIIEA